MVCPLLFSLSLALGLLPSSWAVEGDDPAVLLHESLLRQSEETALLGRSDRSLIARSEQLDSLPEGWERTLLEELWSPLLSGEDSQELRWGSWAWTRLAEGDIPPSAAQGDLEPGAWSWRARPSLLARGEHWELRAAPELRLDLSPVDTELAAPEAWMGLRYRGLRIGAGTEARPLGPSRRGGLILGSAGRPWPAAVVSGERAVDRIGRLRAEMSGGWLQQERSDVSQPGMLHMDFRWAPNTWFEMGASRASLFGGEGRPLPSLGQLLLPTDPHVYDDPNQLEPDQNEIAGLDGRLTLPLHRWSEQLRYLELWIGYAGEDLIILELGSVPYPSLAGVANQRGAELAVGSWTTSVEWAQLMDDYFRWYVGHRIYHEGFTQDGISLGHPNGGDQQTWTWQLRVDQPSWGAQVWTEWLWRVDVIERFDRTLLTAMSDEHRRRYGGQGWWWSPWGRVGLGLQLEQIESEGFVLGQDRWGQRVWLEWSSRPLLSSR